MTAVYVIVYLAVALLVGLCGRHRRMGYLGSLLLAVTITPPLALLFLYLTEARPVPPAGRRGY